jgi:hypothetical protein
MPVELYLLISVSIVLLGATMLLSFPMLPICTNLFRHFQHLRTIEFREVLKIHFLLFLQKSFCTNCQNTIYQIKAVRNTLKITK